MTKRVRLRWNRSQDENVKYYRVYRSEKPNISKHNYSEHLVMRVGHTNTVTPLHVISSKPKRISTHSYRLLNKSILLQDNNSTAFPFVVRVNGTERSDFKLDISEGIIVFDSTVSVYDTVLVDYTFDGVQVDDYEIEEDVKDYSGPGAEDISAPSAPENLTIEADFDENKVTLKWSQSNSSNKRFYYRVDAIIHEGQYSGLSEYASGLLEEPLADRPYVVEKSADGTLWRQFARVEQNVFYEYLNNLVVPQVIKGINASYDFISSSGTTSITIKWIKPTGGIIGNSDRYRVRSINRLGAISEPSSIVGPIPFYAGLKHILLRRKVDDGTLPSYDGADAVTIGQFTDFNIASFVDIVPSNETYIYGIWVVDHIGNHSPIAHTSIKVKDMMPPDTPMIRSINKFKIVVG